MKNEPDERFVEKLTIAGATTERTGTIEELKEQSESDNQKKVPASNEAVSFVDNTSARGNAFSLPGPESTDPESTGGSGLEIGGGEAEIYYKSAKLVTKVLKGVWNVIKDSKAQATVSADTAKILHKGDLNWQNYTGGKEARSSEVEWKLNNFAGVNCFLVRFNVVVQYAVRHSKFPGLWISSIKVLFPQCDASWPWVLEGIAKIDEDSLYNAGSAKEMVPQVRLDVSLNAKAKAALQWEELNRSAAFTVHAKKGISSL